MRKSGRVVKSGLVVLALVMMVLGPRVALSAEYRIRPDRSELAVLVFKSGFAAAFAHDHIVRATQVSGSVRGDPNNPAAAVAEVTVAAGALVADEPALRQAHGLAGTLSDKDRREIQSTMLGENQLHVTAYPEITFRSASVEPRAGGTFLVTGDFTLHGTTRRIAVAATVQFADDTLHATGAFEINQSDFGITPVSLFLGAVRNQDGVRIVFDLIAAP